MTVIPAAVEQSRIAAAANCKNRMRWLVAGPRVTLKQAGRTHTHTGKKVDKRGELGGGEIAAGGTDRRRAKVVESWFGPPRAF